MITDDEADATPAENTSSEDTPIVDEDLARDKTITSFEEFGHLALIGPTESGKTTRFKIFLCDQIINSDLFDKFYYVGPPKQLEEIALSWAANIYLNGKDYKQAQMEYFKLEELDKAILACTNTDNHQMKKFIFLDDALVISKQFNKKISTWIHQAKNYNTTCAISVHEAFGSQDEKMVRSACRYFCGINLNPATTSKLINKPLDSPIIKSLEAESNPHKVFFIYDKKSQTTFNENYKTFNSIN